MLGELILSRRHDQLQHLANTLVSVLGIRLTIPADLAPRFGLIEEFTPGVMKPAPPSLTTRPASRQGLRRRSARLDFTPIRLGTTMRHC